GEDPRGSARGVSKMVPMGKRRLGGSTLEVSVIGLGGNNFVDRIDFAASSRVVGRAIELGINLIDTADSYGDKGGSEEWLGRILGEKRKAIVLASKFGMPMDETGELKGASRHYIMHAVEASLKRLRTDCIDLYQLHRPDPQTPIEETLRALDDLVQQGKVRFLGCSNLSAQQVVEAQATAQQHGLAAFVSCQDEYTMLELAFSWLLRDGVVASVIAGATTSEQVEQNVRAAGWTLSAEDLAEIDRITL